MDLHELFKKYQYCDISSQSEAAQYGLLVGILYDDDNLKPNELMCIYISKTQDELFFVLDGRKRSINELCKKWDRKISNFIAFGSEDRKQIKKLQYNVVQIVLYSEGEEIDHSQEGSLNVSRKILLPCKSISEKSIDIIDNEIVEIPFYIVPVGEYKRNNELLEELNESVPNSEMNDLKFLFNSIKKESNRRGSGGKTVKSLTSEQYLNIKEWLSSNDDSVDRNQ